MDYIVKKLTEENEKCGLTINLSNKGYLRIGNEQEEPQIHQGNKKLQRIQILREHNFEGR